MNSLQAKIAAAMAGYDQVKAKTEAWEKRLPDHFRLGDILLVSPEGIKSSPGFCWMLVKHHPADDQMFYAVMIDSREQMVGLSDVTVHAAVDSHVARPTVGAWIHASDLRLDDRVDHAPEGPVAECRQWIGKVASELKLPESGVRISTEHGSITFSASSLYVEHMEELRMWASVITSCLHDEDADPAELSQAYWDWLEESRN